MATQQVLYAETIAGMKKAFKRKAYDSDSDSEIENYSNRGHKLKKRSRFAHKGQLVPTGGPSAYKEPIEYAGVRRSILHRNPPLIDDEGYEIESGDDDDRVEDAMLAAAELNPYANIRIEHILAPLTASTDLPTHPTLSKPFLSKTLTDLASQSCTIMRKENHSLWQVRHLLTALCGDGTWMPCETMVGPGDAELYSEDVVARHLQNLSKGTGAGTSTPATVNGEHHTTVVNGDSEFYKRPNNTTYDADVSMADASTTDDNNSKSNQEKADETKPVENRKDSEKKSKKKKKNGSIASPDGSDVANGDKNLETEGGKQGDKRAEEGENAAKADGELSSAQLKDARNGNQAPSTSSEVLEQTFIHPMFLPPPNARSDRDLGLPENEAEDIRRLLALYVQKQEEVCRGAKKLHQGLLRAERLRADVLHWAKAEAHSGPNRDMSDGEDWYDKEEWGLTEDLKKGQDEEEEDTTTTGKKTRARR